MTRMASPLSGKFISTQTNAIFDRVYLFTGKPLTAPRSPRTGRLSISEQTRLREQSDPAYAQRMARARTTLANSFKEIGYAHTLSNKRLAKGLSQAQLAEMIGTSQSHIAKIEAGSVNIYLDTAAKLAKALAISLDELQSLIDAKSTADHSAVAVA